MIGTLLGHILDAQGLPREAQEAPRTFQNGAQNAKKSMLKNKWISDSIFSWFGRDFSWFFRRIFAEKIAQIAKKHFCKNLKNSDFL